MNREIINRFVGRYWFLDNFYPTPCEYDGIIYSTSEHAFQAAKSMDLKIRDIISIIPTPAEAKSFGRKISPLREDWNTIRVEVMESVLRSKFNEPELRKKLIDTGDAILIEGNNHRDKFWGMYKGEGENMLGIILMKLREEFKNENNH